jgi:hypothetical protein
VSQQSSWYDIFFGTNYFAGYELRDFLSHFFERGHFAPTAIMSEILHEYTHKFCFDNKLGRFLGLLRSKMWEFGQTGDLDAAIKHNLVVNSAVSVFRPIAEGLALLAEYDLMPDDSTSASAVLQVAFGCFSFFTDPSNSDSIVESYRNFKLDQLFFRREQLPRRRYVDARFDAETQVYALGYFFVKRLYNLFQVK